MDRESSYQRISSAELQTTTSAACRVHLPERARDEKNIGRVEEGEENDRKEELRNEGVLSSSKRKRSGKKIPTQKQHPQTCPRLSTPLPFPSLCGGQAKPPLSLPSSAPPTQRRGGGGRRRRSSPPFPSAAAAAAFLCGGEAPLVLSGGGLISPEEGGVRCGDGDRPGGAGEQRPPPADQVRQRRLRRAASLRALPVRAPPSSPPLSLDSCGSGDGGGGGVLAR